LRSAVSKAAVATKRSAGSYVSNHSSKWAPAIDQELTFTKDLTMISGAVGDADPPYRALEARGLRIVGSPADAVDDAADAGANGGIDAVRSLIGKRVLDFELLFP